MKINELKFGVYLSYISIFVTNITNLVLTPFIVRNLGQSQYGLYMLIGAFIGYIAVLDFGLGNTTVRFVAKYRTEKDKVGQENFLALTFMIYFIISIIVLLIGGILYSNLDIIFVNSLSVKEIGIAKIMFIVLVITLAITLPMKSFTGIVNAYESFVFPKGLAIIRTLLRALVIILLLLMGYKAIAIVVVDAILNLLMMVLTMIYVFFKLNVRIKLHSFNLSLIKEILLYSSLIFVSVIVDQLYWRIGHTILGIMASASEVAIFAIAMLLAQYFITFSTAISGVFLPKITKMVVNKASNLELVDIMIKTGRLQLLILGFVFGGFLLFGKEFITLWLGNGYEDAWLITLIVIIPLVVVLTQSLGISILQAKNMHGFRAVVYLFISLINVFISIYFSSKFGAFGAALGTSLSLIFGNLIVMNFYYHYKVKLNILKFFKELSSGLVFSIIISIMLGSVTLLISNSSWLILIIQCIIFSIIYIYMVNKFGINVYEKNLFKNELNKFKKVFNRNVGTF